MCNGKWMRFGRLCVALCALAVPAARAESTEEAFLRLARKIEFLNYNDFMYQREPRDPGNDPRITAAAAGLRAVLAVPGDMAAFTHLAEHADPKVRMLALIRLYASEEQNVFLTIQQRMSDTAETFPGQPYFHGSNPYDPTPLVPEPSTVGQVATMMMRMLGFQKSSQQDFDEWKKGRIGNPEWIGWYDFLYRCASGSVSPLQAEYLPRIEALKKRMKSCPPALNAWFWLGLADDALMQPSYDTAMATRDEILAAGKQLGPDALLAFLRDGTRAGLREPRVDVPERGRRTILLNGRALFRKQDAAALEEMGHFVAAADADPSMASRLIRKVTRQDGLTVDFDQARAIAALLDLRGDDEAEYIIRWFYETPDDSSHSSNRCVFFTEVERRAPKVWEATLRGIVAHPHFEYLSELDVIYTGLVVNQLSGKEVLPKDKMTSGWAHETRNLLREHFGLPQVHHQRLEKADAPAETPLWGVGLDTSAHSIALSPDGKVVALAMPEGILLLDAGNGEKIGELAVKDDRTVVHFRQDDGRLLVLNSAVLTTWDLSKKEVLATVKPAAGFWNECAIPPTASMIASREVGGSEPGVALYDLPEGTLRWRHPMPMRGFGPIDISNDGSRIAVADTFSHDVHLFDTASPAPIARLPGHGGAPRSACFSPDGHWLITGGKDKVLLWDGRTGKPRQQFLGTWAGYALCFSADSKEFLTLSDRGQLTRFDVETGKPVGGYRIKAGYVRTVVASRDGRHVFALLEGTNQSNQPASGSTTVVRQAEKAHDKPYRVECWAR